MANDVATTDVVVRDGSTVCLRPAEAFSKLVSAAPEIQETGRIAPVVELSVAVAFVRARRPPIDSFASHPSSGARRAQ